MRRAGFRWVIVIGAFALTACAQTAVLEPRSLDDTWSAARASLIGLPLAALDACAVPPISSADEPKFSRRTYYARPVAPAGGQGPVCVLDVEARDGLVDRFVTTVGGPSPRAESTCAHPVAACVAGGKPARADDAVRFVPREPLPTGGDVRRYGAGEPRSEAPSPLRLHAAFMTGAPLRAMPVADFVTPMEPSSPSLTRAEPAADMPVFRPQTQCIRFSARPAAADEPAVAAHWRFDNVCSSAISLWYCDRRGCPRMTFHARVEPGGSTLHAVLRESRPSSDGGDWVACPAAAEFARRDGEWLCSRAP